MKRLVYILCIGLLFSCEDVIELDLPTEEPRLVIDASINWFKGTTGNEQSIKLSLTAPFFEENVPPANDATVFIIDENNTVYNFTENGSTGVYQNTNFDPVIGRTYSLTVIYEGETYTATETLLSVSEITRVEQRLDGGFSQEDTEIKAFFNDPADEENYYFFEFIPSIPVIPTLDAFQDEFVNGNETFGFYVEEDLEPGETVTIRIHGVSERFYEYMFILLQQIDDGGGGPFETQPATVRGNCINETDPNNFPFGFFRLSEVDEFIYTVIEE